MIAFYLAAAALVVATLVLLLRPWWHRDRRSASADSQATLNVAVHRDRLAEIERDHRHGALSATDLAEARDELQRQLLEDTAAAEAVRPDVADRRTGIALGLTLPALAAVLYALLGTPSAVLPEMERTQRSAVDMEQLTVRLARKLEQDPNNPEGWAMLARSYKSLGRWDDAERAFGRIGPTFEQNAELLAEYAEMLVQRDSGFGDQARARIRKSLEIDPHNMLALFLGGGEAFENGRYTEAITLWERLLPQLQAGGDDAQMVEAGIARARDHAGRASSAAPRTAAPGTAGRKAQDTAKTSATSGKGTIRGRVELSPALKGKVEPNDSVFIFARAIDGPRMPLAALRARAADLPIDFTLDDSQALSADVRLSTATRVRVEVRVSKSGNAMPGKGDLTGSSDPVKPGATDLRIKIDKITP